MRRFATRPRGLSKSRFCNCSHRATKRGFPSASGGEALWFVRVGDADDLVGDEALVAFSARYLAKDPSFDELPYVRRGGCWRDAKEGRCVSEAHGWTFE